MTLSEDEWNVILSGLEREWRGCKFEHKNMGAKAASKLIKKIKDARAIGAVG